MKNPTSATTAADMPGSSERLKHSADVGGGEMKAGEGCVRGAEGGCRRKGGGGGGVEE